MKKTLTAAITSALAIGVASVTFAAANPFSDVPTNHWSFEAVAKLAQDGVIEGYGDNTFKGDAHITRYEMAQMVAKAMAKEDIVDSQIKATIDKLAAEYADELNNLGVRVANLEKKSDNVQFTGLMRLNNSRTWEDGANKVDKNAALLRLNVKAKVNEDWNVRGRIEGTVNLQDNSAGTVTVQHVYAEGPLLGAKAKIGRYGDFDMPGFTVGGLLLDSKSDGLSLVYDGALRTSLNVGRIGSVGGSAVEDVKANYAAVQFAYKASKNFKVGAGYFHTGRIDNQTFGGSTDSKNGIWELAFDYAFNKDITLGAIYAASSVDGNKAYGEKGSNQEKSYNVQLTYKGADIKVPGSYGVWLGYRQQGELASYTPTYVTSMTDSKGFELGFDYMFDKNILAKVAYYDAKALSADKVNKSMLFGRLEFSF